VVDIHPIVIIFAAAFTNNILLTGFLGMCPFIAVSKEVSTSLGLGQAVTFVLTFTSMINWLVYNYILVPYNLEYLRFIVFIVVIASFVQITEIIIERFTPALYLSLGVFLPLITVNCAILGVSLFMIIRNYSFYQAGAFGFGSGLGWMLAIIAMAAIRQRIKVDRVPEGLRGPGITLIIAGIMAIAFIGFSGIVFLQ
jgi:Na+-transporting NADH:ubiquinone oxidoreductase subunit E